ncbi:PIG-L deacetylase family protein [Mycobacteroides franklinii]|uniref:GlcNAc-PI de-N-acetylase n=1 Tax=Mycobacteroides franklinii TaxID=948102 RepID=A0A4R8R2R9_9MYCO|nr:PIG-L family deacetylase [Mycobacteroides franklinii]TDZ45317.1 GlcNAc-PI de-N-acetylase [Mycobacteroides franklinii]TDZ48808.1 GlcNAc-PI de-N-acetylase [Mycobacteroides franklinii]TDZ58989.1 GlcNAc-PI de-N-acetylase [Mycobacteroides franklinii]TDZ66503.1 GlcNAc-PI de-N-acetylase [Mycobacteroides franklinii]TDZ72426.1 GlcNAc-PI de-N-acetylase [Mycobacteroides franklinii]
MIELGTGPVDEIALLAAHCDDIAIGMGGTLLTMTGRHPGLRVRALVLSGANTERESEERAALAALCPGAEVTIDVLDFPDGRAPAHWDEIKDALAAFRRQSAATLVFTPQRHDAHQDHRLLASLAPTEFRDHLILGYEIIKWETDTPTPTVFQPLSDEIATSKADLIYTHYPSQRPHDWFDHETFLALARVRGVQCRHRYAEGFVLEKATISLGATQ